MDNGILSFIFNWFNNPTFTGFFGVFIGAFLEYILQKRLNNKQNKFSIENKVLEGLMEKTNGLALKISENNFPYAINRFSNELRKYVKISPIEIDDKIQILKIASLCNEKDFEIIRYIDNIIVYFKLNLIPIYRLNNYKKKIECLLNNYSLEYQKYSDKISKISEILQEDKKISDKYVDSVTYYENTLSSIKNELLFYLTNLNIVIQNELYKKVYQSKVKLIEDSRYEKIEMVEEIPSIIDINE